MRRAILWICFALLLTACGGGKEVQKQEEDLTAKEMLQGIWLDDNTDMPLMRIEGDTIYYVDPQNAPAAFKIVHDTIYIYGNTPTAYKIDAQTEYSFRFHSLVDDIICMHKSENPEDELSFTSSHEVEVIPTISEVIEKDSVVMYKGTRYRGYVYINPSQMKVIKTSYSEEGMSVDNVYYDNVIHICVYEGKRQLYGKDITKKEFADVVEEEWLRQVILSDMDFMGVKEDGYHYQAVLRVPESSVYNLINIVISFDGEMKINKADMSE
ncbi:MAG: DUF4738 domain-containing protein [Bacteroides sp.]|nr:DUF4738 domain-containing protein [Bacteroides sp.]